MSATNITSLWQPPVGATWNYYLQSPVNLSLVTNTSLYDAWGVDLFANPASTIQTLQSGSSHVICYFSAGSYEDFRPDASNFSSPDLGNPLQGWPGERWLNISSPNVRNIMLRRLDLAVEKNCTGVDPDNVDGYANPDTGFNLTAQDSIDYMLFLANATSERGLSIGLKNAQAIIPNILDRMHWAVNEQCTQYEECAAWGPFINASKPVFHVEYPKGDKNNNDPVTAKQLNESCNDPNAKGFSTILKNLDLDWWIESCDGTVIDAPASSGSDGSNSSAAQLVPGADHFMSWYLVGFIWLLLFSGV